MTTDHKDHQGGKKFGQMMTAREDRLDVFNQELLEDDNLKEVEDLADKLETYKKKFIEFDQDNDDVIGFRDLQMMMEKLDQTKTHLELKKMIKEVDKTGLGSICYKDFIDMMLGTKTSVLKMVLMFEEKARQKQPVSNKPPPKRSIQDLP